MNDVNERAILVALRLKGIADWVVNDHLDELTQLADTAGAQILGRFTQRMKNPDPATFLGKGKVRELADEIKHRSADSVIFDDDLTPAQVRNLEQTLNAKVLDRSGVILDIFARRARSRESRTQVELAQLNYLLPRLTRRWGHLSRQIGGIGVRGPGETQLEVDRRLVRERIAKLTKELEKIEKSRQVRRRKRENLFKTAIVGYTNAGKSTLLNALTGSAVQVENRLFATLDSTTRKLTLDNQAEILLTDTVGFIRKLPHHLVESFRATLEEARHADLLLHVVDSASPTAYQQIEAVDLVLADLGCASVPQITVLNKTDLATDNSLMELLAHRRTELLGVSAVTGAGLANLTEAVAEAFLGDTAEVTISLPPKEGKLIAEIDRLAEVLRREYGPDAVRLDIRINRTQLKQLLGRHPDLAVTKGDVEPVDEYDLEEFT